MGQATSPPYTVNIAPILVGSYAVVAVAVDNVGGMTASAAVPFTVSATLTTRVLQRGLAGYAGVSDTYLDAFAPTVVRGAATALNLDPATYRPLVRFAIFQAEGGPVPNGAVIQSATLALYKQFYNDTLQLNALLKPWVEAEATWTNASAGVPWTVGGASGAGTDYSTTADALVTPSFNPGWVSFDVTARLRQWTSSVGVNNGLDSDADRFRLQYQVLRLERVHDRHHAAAQTHHRLLERGNSADLPVEWHGDVGRCGLERCEFRGDEWGELHGHG